jgi:hypothetical protein
MDWCFARIFNYPQFSIYAIFVLENKNLLSFPCSYIHLYMFFTFKTQEMVWCFARIFDYPQYSIIRYSNQWSKLYYACTYIWNMKSWNLCHVMASVFKEDRFLFVCLMVFYATFSYIVSVSFIGGGNRRTLRNAPTCCKSLTNLIT